MRNIYPAASAIASIPPANAWVNRARVWDTCAQYAVPPLQEWDAQDERTRARFTQAFAGGIEAMAEAAG